MRPCCIVGPRVFIHTSNNTVSGNIFRFIRCMYKLAVPYVYSHMIDKRVVFAVFSAILCPEDYVSGSWRLCGNVILILFHIGHSLQHYASGSDLFIYLIHQVRAINMRSVVASIFGFNSNPTFCDVYCCVF